MTRWSKLDNEWEGVPIREIMSRIRLKPEARYVMVHADPDYTTNLALEDLVQDDVLLALQHRAATWSQTTAVPAASSSLACTSGRAPSGSGGSSSWT